MPKTEYIIFFNFTSVSFLCILSLKGSGAQGSGKIQHLSLQSSSTDFFSVVLGPKIIIVLHVSKIMIFSIAVY